MFTRPPVSSRSLEGFVTGTEVEMFSKTWEQTEVTGEG